jgi:phenylacetate-coenzyme A ligase PaaK-like adenylate-forming protein
MHLNDDFCIVEPVDVQGKSVPSGVQSAKIYLTNRFNHTLPLIRYEVTDEVTILDEPCSCGSAHRRMDDVMGRLDDSFVYASGIRIHRAFALRPTGYAASHTPYRDSAMDTRDSIQVGRKQ